MEGSFGSEVHPEREIASSVDDCKLDSIRQAKVMELLRNAEKEHGFKIIFACETGSRCYGLETRDSDVDVKGMFVYPPSVYVSVEKRVSYLKLNHEIKLFGETDLDLELVDLRKYLRHKCKITSFDEAVMWFRNPNPYINLLSPALIDAIVESQAAPLFQIQSKIIKYLAKFEKNIVGSSEPTIIIAKDVLNSIVQSFQILSVVIFAGKASKEIITSETSVQAITLNFEESARKLILEIQNQLKDVVVVSEEKGDDSESRKERLEELKEAVQKMHEIAKQLFEMKLVSNQAKISMSNPILKPYFSFVQTHVLKPAYIDRNPSFDLIPACNDLFTSVLAHLFPDEM